MGISEAGFTHEAVLEWDRYSCDTIRENQRLGVESVADWPLHEEDIRTFDYSGIGEEPDLIAGGPPCQPFSLGGRHGGWNDERDMFPEMVRATRELKPKAIIVENVKGLLRKNFARYFEYIVLQISYPELAPKKGEEWNNHLSRLERHHVHGQKDGLFYRVVFRLLNAADYGVPQKRERVVIVGFRQDLETVWSFPTATHSHDALLWDQWVTGDYWDRHEVPIKARPSPSPRLKGRIMRLDTLFAPSELPWTTVRDAISDLPDPEGHDAPTKIPNHNFNPGARSYHGHTGSQLDYVVRLTAPQRLSKQGITACPAERTC